MKGSFWTELEMIDRGGWELLFHIFPLKFSLHHSVLFIMNTRWCSLNPNADSCQSWQSSPDPRHSNLFFKGIKSVESVRPAFALFGWAMTAVLSLFTGGYDRCWWSIFKGCVLGLGFISSGPVSFFVKTASFCVLNVSWFATVEFSLIPFRTRQLY